ncbi:FixH family protein [Deinococcus oregonensis]|uniref:FixH family protein n=1 Tax=Deinococcus oregonensis TaxID=1805970 RepID=A0ABV6B210_9DEIO
MHNTTSLRARFHRVRRSLLITGALLSAGILAAAIAIRSNGVPANLDYSTSRTSNAGVFNATYTPGITPIPIHKLHHWTLHLETPDGQPIEGARIQVDGDMPQHGHGLPTQPQVTQEFGNGDYLVEGLKFQMGGWWVMDYQVTVKNRVDTVRFNLLLR